MAALHLLPVAFSWKGSALSHAQYPVLAIVVYLSVIFALQRFMRNRPPVKLTAVTLVHNVFLCALSAAMGAGVLFEVARLGLGRGGSAGGVREVLCDVSGSGMGGRLGWWMYVFYLSKFYELGDTVIMVLKKRRLNFLHVYHHCIVIPLFYVYMSTSMVLQWILVVANSSVHVAMYYYYAMSSVGKTVWWKKYITQAQIVQFIIDLTATWPYPALYFSATGCSGTMRGWFFGQAVGLSFFKLFRDFYVRSYRKKRQAKTMHAGEVAATGQLESAQDTAGPSKDAKEL